MTEELQLQEVFHLSDSVFSSGAMKKSLTAEQIREDLVSLGIHTNLSSRDQFMTGLSKAAGLYLLMTACYVTKVIPDSYSVSNTLLWIFYTWNRYCLSDSSGLNEDKAAHFSQQVTFTTIWRHKYEDLGVFQHPLKNLKWIIWGKVHPSLALLKWWWSSIIHMKEQRCSGGLQTVS